MNIESLKNNWFQLCKKEDFVQSETEELWTKIANKYSERGRAYHNLQHLENMFLALKPFENKVEDLSILKFSIWFHDIIYNSTKKDNELRSAEMAQEELLNLGIEKGRVERCFAQIMSTKIHQFQDDFQSFDERLLIDLDLDVLSWDWEKYLEYTQQIREEYKIYPMFLYKKGRKAAMQKFVERPQIYFTKAYLEEKEEKAKANLRKEIELL